MEVCEIVLSDSSDDLDGILSFKERVDRLIHSESTEIKRNSPKKQRKSAIHSISDSEESDSQDHSIFNKKPASSVYNFPRKENDLQKLGTCMERSPPAICNFIGSKEFDSHDKTIFNKKSTSSVYNFIGKESDSQDQSILDRISAPSVNVIPFKQKESKTSVYSISSSDDELPDLPDFFFKKHHPVSNVQDTNLMKGILDLNNLPDLDGEYTECHATPSKQDGKPHKKTKKSPNKDIEKERKMQIREEKKKQKELEKALKESEKEVMNSQKPTECLKSMRIIIDHNILDLSGSQQLFNILDANNLKHGVEDNVVKNSVVWYRTVTNIDIKNSQVVKEQREEPTNVMILVISNEEFLKMIHSSSQKVKGRNSENVPLADFIVNIKNFLPHMEMTCITIGFDKFMRNLKEEGSSDIKYLSKQVQKNTTEQVLTELQLQTFINFHFLNDIVEFGNLLCQFTKAVAEAPQRREKQLQKSSAFSWYADVDSNCPVKLGKDSASFIKLWRQQIQQFNNVGPEVAEAIVSRYPSPRLLLKAYRECSSSKEAENLLQDIVVRRNYGPLGTQKRIGPELSFKIYLFFTSKDSFKLLKR